MAWQCRGSASYYYKSERIAGRVRCWYFGTGPAAELAAVWDQLRLVERLEERERLQARQERERAADAALDRLCEAARLLAHAALLAEGYHQHARGEWRKRRVKKR